MSRERRIDTVRAALDGDDRVRDRQREILMRMDSDLRFRIQNLTVGLRRAPWTPFIVSAPAESVMYTQSAP